MNCTAEQRHAVEDRARRCTLPYQEVAGAKIVLMATAGLDNDEIAARLDGEPDGYVDRRELHRPPSGLCWGPFAEAGST